MSFSTHLPSRRGDSRHVAIVGGGIVGIACAHYLNLQGHRVTVIDKGRVGGGCSHGNCGYVSPSHALPLAEPGAIFSTIKAMLKPNPPLRIRPGLNVPLWKWLWNFSRRCNRSDWVQSGHAIHPLLTASMQLYSELIPSYELDCEWTKQGLLFVYKDAKALQAYAPIDALLRRDFDEPARLMSARELLEFEPALSDDVAGAWYFEHDAHLRPARLVASWRDSLLARGVVFIENQTLESVTESAGEAQSLKLSSQCIEADQFVIATGAWTPQLEKVLRFRVPIQPGKGYSMTMPRPAVCPQTPMILPERKVAVTPWETELRLGSMMEFIGYDSDISKKRLRLLTRAAADYLKSELPDSISETWCGWRPMTYDSTPIIGRCPSFSNVYLACGHNMLGLSMAPATGRMISELIAGEPTSLAAEPYQVERFTA
ncbi:D-amino acid dehydrogenase small subunit [Novipirellula galeiformis]|uniref:D-amino acid dehydrogenase small subunit n=1 Tax=Novipirellula galeiformis TaxID=2528004 RepID=A0A5C6BDL5_9BACT|nr:FAD-dependent oxidoreductase [Novipirellula galeiformis]TWU10070.1 D-amino acid dehydrogenase small subunit [Novipirellula galeiformis]